MTVLPGWERGNPLRKRFGSTWAVVINNGYQRTVINVIKKHNYQIIKEPLSITQEHGQICNERRR